MPAGLVQTIPQALSHPHTIHREMVIELDGNRWAGIPVKLSDTPGKLRRGPPEFNEHVDEILREHGFDDAEILELRQRKVLGQPRIRQGDS